jgi:hypothetical protein
MFTTLIKSKYADICAKCGCTISIDKPIFWEPKNKKAYHPTCRPSNGPKYRFTAFEKVVDND